MSLNYSFGPALGAELDYRHERLVEAARGTRRMRRGHTRRTTRTLRGTTLLSRIGVARPAH